MLPSMIEPLVDIARFDHTRWLLLLFFLRAHTIFGTLSKRKYSRNIFNIIKEELTELQEDILRVCQAAHVPVVWATGVLEGLARRGHPVRAEITDAGVAQRAECVMLGKGAYITRALDTLDGILCRMRDREYKQQAMLGELRLAP